MIYELGNRYELLISKLTKSENEDEYKYHLLVLIEEIARQSENSCMRLDALFDYLGVKLTKTEPVQSKIICVPK